MCYCIGTIVLALMWLAFANATIYSFVASVYTRLGGILRRIYDQMMSVATAEIDTGVSVEYAKLLCEVLKVPVKYSVEFAKVISSTFTYAGKQAAAGNQIIKFLSDNIDVIRKVCSIVLYKETNQPVIKNYLNSDAGRAGIEMFIEAVDLIKDPANEYKLLSSPKWAALVYKLKAVSSALSVQLSRDRSVVNSAVFYPYFKVVNDKYVIVKQKKIFSPIGTEPFVVYFTGEPGIGKSVLVEKILLRILKLANISDLTCDPIYTRSPGSNYWDALRGEPALLYDDFMQIGGTDDKSVAELFALKTAANFKPPMAALEEKGVTYNPTVIGLSSNTAFPKDTRVQDETALWRRRDLLVEAIYVPKDKSKKNIKRISQDTYTNDELDVLSHLRFKISKDPANEQSLQHNKTLTYSELLVQLDSTYKTFVLVQSKLEQKRISAFEQFIESNDKLDELTDAMSVHLNTYFDELAVAYGQIDDDDDTESLTPYSSDNASLSSMLIDDDYQKDKMVDVVLPQAENPKNFVAADDYIMLVINRTVPINQTHGYKSDLNDEHYFSCCLHNFMSDDLLPSANGENFTLGELTIFPRGCIFLDGDGLLTPASCLWNRLSYQRNYIKQANSNLMALKKSNPGVYQHFKFFPDLHASTSKMRVKDFIRKNLDLSNHIQVDMCDRDEAFFNGLGYKWRKSFIMQATITSGAIFVGYRFFSKIYELLTSLFGVIRTLLPYQQSVVTGDAITALGIPEGGGKTKEYNPATSYSYKKNKPKKGTTKVSKADRVVELAHTCNSDTCWSCLSMAEGGSADALLFKMYSNFFHVTIASDSGHEINARCFGLKQHLALIPHHYYEEFAKLKAATLEIAFKDKVITFTKSEILDTYKRIPNTGLGLINVPLSLGMFKDITKHLLEKIDQIPGDADFLSSVNTGAKMTYNSTLVNISTGGEISVSGADHYNPWTSKANLRYNKHGAGLCGSVLMIKTKTNVYIVAMHTAGISLKNEGIGEFILRSQVETAENACRANMQEVPKYYTRDYDEDDLNFHFDTDIFIEGMVEKEFKIKHGEKTHILPTPLVTSLGPAITSPVPLSSKDTRLDASLHEAGFKSPLLCGVRKRGMLPFTFDEDLLSAVKASFGAKLINAVKPTRSEIGYIEPLDAARGFDLTGYDQIDLSTSEGFPWVKDRPPTETNKAYLFSTDSLGKINDMDDTLLAAVKQKNNMRRMGIVPQTIFSSCLKDERKPLHKIPIPGKTRVFDISPIDATISHRCYTLDFTAAYTSARFKADHAVGIAPDGLEWNELYYNLNSFSRNIIVADYSNFGPTLSFQCVRMAFDLITEWYQFYGNTDEKFAKALSSISYEIGLSLNLAGNVVYRTLAGLPSGCSLTVYLNSLVNCIYLRYMFLKLSIENGHGYLSRDFDELVVCVVYGDDLILSVKSEIIDWFNSVTLSEAFAEYNITLTDVTKDGSIRPFCKIEEAEFLKRKFKYTIVDGQTTILAPLSLESILETCRWYHEKPNVKEAVKEVCDGAINNLYGHGEAVFNHYTSIICKAYERYYKEKLVHATWFELHATHKNYTPVRT